MNQFLRIQDEDGTEGIINVAHILAIEPIREEDLEEEKLEYEEGRIPLRIYLYDESHTTLPIHITLDDIEERLAALNNKTGEEPLTRFENLDLG